MNKICTSERLSGLLAFALSGLFHIAAALLILFWMKTRPPEPRAFSPAPVNLGFAQIELQAVAGPPPEAQPDPEPLSEEVLLEPVLPEPAEMALELAPEESPPPEPQPRVVETPAQVTQQSSAPSAPSVDRDVLLNWVREQIEKEKYYPPAARNAGLEGQFRLLVKMGADGNIVEASVLDGKGHPMLRRALEKILGGLAGRDFGRKLPAPVELPFEFEFKLD